MKRYFGTDGIRGVAGEMPMTAGFALHVGVALAEVLTDGQGDVLVGCDTRRSSDMLVHALAAGLTSRGANVRLLGVLPTPAVSFLTRTTDAAAGVVVSASHNPFEQNGIKVFQGNGKKLSDALEHAIEAAIDAAHQDASNGSLARVTGSQIGRSDFAEGLREQYLESLLTDAPDLTGIKVALDCANGAAFASAPHAFRALGADVTVINDAPDGNNINVNCGSTHPQAFQALLESGDFDVGVTFDGDADRALLVDKRGRLVTGDHILALCALARHETTVVSTLMANLGLEHFLAERGVNLLRTQVGDRYVYEALEAQKLTLGGEQSGHVLFLDRAPTGDGVLTALQTLAAVNALGESLEHWVDALTLYPQTLLNVPVDAALKAHIAEHDMVKAALQQAEADLAGWGRINVRPSGTEPLVRVMVEGSDAVRMQSIAERVAAAVARVA
jgi:phosphoglucosamine mutase